MTSALYPFVWMKQRFERFRRGDEQASVQQKLATACGYLLGITKHNLTCDEKSMLGDREVIGVLFGQVLKGISRSERLDGNLLMETVIVENAAGDKVWTTLLNAAVGFGNVKLVQKLLKAFRSDLSHESPNYLYPNQLPLNTACLEDLAGGLMVSCLLEHGADMWRSSGQVNYHPAVYPRHKLQQDTLPALFRGTAPHYALARDDPAVFMVLWRGGLGERISLEELLRIVIAMEAADCLRALLESGHVPRDDARLLNKCLFLASVTDLGVTEALLDAGITYDTEFARRYPDILRRIYERLCRKPPKALHAKRDCEILTKRVLERFMTDSPNEALPIDRATVLCLIERFGFPKQLGKTEAVDFFTDIVHTFELLLSYKPGLLGEVDDALEVLVDVWLLKYRQRKAGAHDPEILAEAALLLLRRGATLPYAERYFLIAVVALVIGHIRHGTHVTGPLVRSFTELIARAVDAGCHPDASCTGPAPMLLALWNAVFQEEERVVYPQLTLLVSSISYQLFNAGVSLHQRIDYTLPPSNAFCDAEVVSTTYLNNILRHLTTFRIDTHVLWLTLTSLVTRLYHEDAVDFSCCKLVKSNMSLLWDSLSNLRSLSGNKDHKYVYALAIIFRAILLHRPATDRNECVKWFEIYQKSHIFFNEEDEEFTEIVAIFDSLVSPCVHTPASLKDTCRLEVMRRLESHERRGHATAHRRHPWATRDASILTSAAPQYDADTDTSLRTCSDSATRSSTGVCRRHSDSLESYRDKSLLQKLKSCGLGPQVALRSAAALPLPRDLQWFVGGALEEDTFREVTCALELFS